MEDINKLNKLYRDIYDLEVKFRKMKSEINALKSKRNTLIKKVDSTYGHILFNSLRDPLIGNKIKNQLSFKNLESLKKIDKTLVKNYNFANLYFVDKNGKIINYNSFKKLNYLYDGNESSLSKENKNKINNTIQKIANKAKYGDIIVYPNDTYSENDVHKNVLNDKLKDEEKYSLAFVNKNKKLVKAYRDAYTTYIMPNSLKNIDVKKYLSLPITLVNTFSYYPYSNKTDMDIYGETFPNLRKLNLDSVKYATKQQIDKVINTRKLHNQKLPNDTYTNDKYYYLHFKVT